MRTEGRASLVAEAGMDQTKTLPPYILITPSRNEEEFIEKTIASVIRQTVLPLKWVIVNDGSTDSTGAIAERYASKYNWIEVVNRPVRQERNFAAKVHAFNAGLERVKHLDYEVVGNLDSDISFDPDHFEFLIARFKEDPRLGVAGTVFREEGYVSERDSFEGKTHVSGQCQLFRRRCFEEIGGYFANKNGGIDWIAVTTARMKGWRTRSFREKYFYHYRPMGTAGRTEFQAAYMYGHKDYCMGAHPLWEAFRVFYRMFKRPYLIAGFGLGWGYACAVFQRAQRPISKELVRFYRREQMRKLRSVVRSLVTFKKIDKFDILPD